MQTSPPVTACLDHPPPCVARAERVLLFGGSFDPPHAGHARLPFEAARLLWPGRPSWVVFVPASRSPHKGRAPAADRHRVEMLRLALRTRIRWWIWEEELRRAELERDPDAPSYWADTWAAARAAFPAADRAFLIGADQALSMHRWRRFEEFWADAVVMPRDGNDTAARFAVAMGGTGAWTNAQVAHWSSRFLDTPSVAASSESARAALADPTRANTRIDGLDPGVQAYAVDRGLYTRV